MSLRFLILTCFLSLLGLSAQAQWMVYDVRITADEEASVNFNPYTGIYLLAPIEGGPATMIFVTEKAGRVYAVSRDAGRYFIAANAQKRRGVFSSIIIDGTVHAMYQATGALNGTVSYRYRGERRASRIPLTMTGSFMASDSESTVAVPSDDIGVAGHATLTATFRSDLTRILQDQTEQEQEKVTATITQLLEKYGYQPDTEPLPSDANSVDLADQPGPPASDLAAAAKTSALPHPSLQETHPPPPSPEPEPPDGTSLFPPGSVADAALAGR